MLRKSVVCVDTLSVYAERYDAYTLHKCSIFPPREPYSRVQSVSDKRTPRTTDLTRLTASEAFLCPVVLQITSNTRSEIAQMCSQWSLLPANNAHKKRCIDLHTQLAALFAQLSAAGCNPSSKESQACSSVLTFPPAAGDEKREVSCPSPSQVFGAVVSVHEQYCWNTSLGRFVFPRGSAFVWCDVFSGVTDVCELIRSQKLFRRQSLLLVDPPWPNRSRGKRYGCLNKKYVRQKLKGMNVGLARLSLQSNIYAADEGFGGSEWFLMCRLGHKRS
jgi:hypothetical protein